MQSPTNPSEPPEPPADPGIKVDPSDTVTGKSAASEIKPPAGPAGDVGVRDGADSKKDAEEVVEDAPEVKALLANPKKITKDGVNEAFRALSVRRAVCEAEMRRIESGLTRLRDIAGATREKRMDCFGQYDPSAPFCTKTCRDPVCPSYTEQTRPARIAALTAKAKEVSEERGEDLPKSPVTLSGDGTAISVGA